ncbi:MAG: hypothetical protein K1X56_11550 [Flavobacteriales bacterium]|nr:hypothetical protein [Flavobacteriales bacterium]
MKRIYLLLALPAMLSLHSCGGGENKGEGENSDSTNTESAEVDYTGMSEFDLNPHGLKTTIMVTDIIAENGDPFPVNVVQDRDMLTWDVKVGNEGTEEFYLVIEEVDGEGNYIAREKERLANDVVFAEEFIVDEPNLFLYKASLPEGAGQRDYFHVFGLVKIGGVEYIAKSFAMGEYSKVQAEDMLKAIRSIK